MDAEGYFNGTAAGDITMALGGGAVTYSGLQYKLIWDAGYQFQEWDFATAAMASCTGIVNATVISGCTNFNAKIGSTGGAGEITFTLLSGGFGNIFIRAGKTASHTPGAKIALYRVDQQQRYLDGVHSTPQHEALMSDLGAATIRTMGWVNKADGNLNNEVKWVHRVKPESFSWNARQIIPAVWAGPISCVCGVGSDTYTVVGAPDPDVIVGTIANINTVTNPTLNGIPIKTTGAVTLVVGAAAGASYSITAGLATFVKDPVLNVYLYSPNGIAASIPVEVPIQLANRTNKNLWFNIPAMADDDYVTQLGTTVCSTALGIIFPEYTNELWLDTWPQTLWGRARGDAFGFVGASQNANSWYGLRVREIMGNLLPPVCSGQLARLKPVLALNATNDNNMLPYRMRTQSVATIADGGTGNAAYTAYNGGQNYTTLGQRAADVVSAIGQAPYVSGGNLCFGPDFNGCGGVVNASLAPVLQSVIDAYEAANNALVISIIDNDVRRGRNLIQTVTCVGTTCSTPTAHGYTINSTRIVFEATGGTLYSGLDTTKLYRVSGTSTAGCPGAVICNFTFQGYDANGEASGANVNAGAAGTGTMTVGAANQRTLLGMGNQFSRWGENTAAAFDADNATLGRPPLGNRQYEGNVEIKGPSAAQAAQIGLVSSNPSFTYSITSLVGNTVCMSSMPFVTNEELSLPSVGSITGVAILTRYYAVGISGNCMGLATSANGSALALGGSAGIATIQSVTDISATVTAAVAVWVASAAATSTTQAYFSQFMGLDPSFTPTYGLMPHSRAPSWLVILCALDYQMLIGCLPTSTPNGYYYGYRMWARGAWLLKRDLDPASNDNDPMWLEKAA